MQWLKQGLIFRPQNNEWMVTHSQLPVADHMHDDIYRIYFASRNRKQYSQIGYFEIDITNPRRLLRVSDKPVLTTGPIGFFDEHGVYPSCIVNCNGKKYLYYIGWNQGNRPPLFYASIGLAISEDGGDSFYRYSKAPIMSRSEYDPCLVTSPYVIKEGDIWKMNYVSGLRWESNSDTLKSYYHIKYVESQNGIDWGQEGVVAIDFKSSLETNIARPCIIKESGIYKMWYCYVCSPNSYRIGYAESKDCKKWIRKDERVGIDITKNSFDSFMICYPNVVVHKGGKYMFYNGNNYGKEGVGLAISC